MFDWTDYLDLARQLAKCPAEAFQRSAISRAYYASYCQSRNWLVQKGEIIPEHTTDHNKVWFAMQRRKMRETVQIEQEGKRLRDQRNMADYDDVVDNLDFRVSISLRHAEKINKLITALRNSGNKK